ncbi:ribose-phosphate diphosphokinase [Nocardia pseudovaccinii]|uniref:ribose-phosphate diphosphokinase n=1 Tax=Nocardia pseudovaccinii TaxID=189540 RepID=UPI003D91E200
MTALRIVSGSANPELAAAVADRLDVDSLECVLERFPDGEICPVVDHVCGSDVHVGQPTAPPVNDHLVELLRLLDACRPERAERVTAVAPYFGYARQDRRTRSGQALGLRVVVEAIARAGADRLVVVDPHTEALEAISPVPVEILTAVPLVPPAATWLRALPLRRVIVTDTVAQHDSAAPFEVRSVAALLADAIARMHHNQPLRELLAHT